VAYLDIREVDDTTGAWKAAAMQLAADGARDVERVVRAIGNATTVELLEGILEPKRLQRLASTSDDANATTADADTADDLEKLQTEIAALYRAVQATIEGPGAAGTSPKDDTQTQPVAADTRAQAPPETDETTEPPPTPRAIAPAKAMPTADVELTPDVAARPGSTEAAETATAALARCLINASTSSVSSPADAHDLTVLAAWTVLRHAWAASPAARRELVDEQALEIAVERSLQRSGVDIARSERAADLLRALLAVDCTADDARLASDVVAAVRTDAVWQQACGVNSFEGVRWIDRERMVDALRWLERVRQHEPQRAQPKQEPQEHAASEGVNEAPTEAERPAPVTKRVLDAGDRCLWRLDRIRGAFEHESSQARS
jgi:hypothetical protein